MPTLTKRATTLTSHSISSGSTIRFRPEWLFDYAGIRNALAEIPRSNNYGGLAEVAEAHFRKGWGTGEKDVFANLAPLAIELVVSAFCVVEARCDEATLKQAFPSFSAQQFVQIEWLVAKYGNKPA